MRTRSELLTRLRARGAPDIVIIGGGINGVGIYRDLAAQGIPALLVDAGDFSSGTSAAPSRLIHGGLRYLETGETALVRESLLERDRLLHNARHMVYPQPVWIPLKSYLAGSFDAALRFFKLKKTPGRKGALPVALGLRFYDIFGRKTRVMPKHRIISAAKARAAIPSLAPDVIMVGEFHDARISHPERLVLELIADAEADCPDAMALPYLAAGKQSGGTLTLTDRERGEEITVTPKIVVNAAGAWVDQVQSGLGFSGRLMGGTRGTHLVIRNPALLAELKGRMLYFETKDFRACLALPLDADHVYVGTTDIRTDDPDDTRYTEAEVDYIFDVLRPVLPKVAWRREDVVFVMAGIRPLPFQDNKVGAAGAISRDHRIDHFAPTAERPFETFTLVGGKWTTYRALAEEAVDDVLKHLGQPRVKGTGDIPIGGAKDLPAPPSKREEWTGALATETGVDPARCSDLVARYGSGAQAFAKAEAGDNRRFEALDGYTPAEIGLICQTERVSRLEDIVLRRTLMGFEGRTSRAALEDVAAVAADVLKWSDDRRDSEVQSVISTLKDTHMVPGL